MVGRIGADVRQRPRHVLFEVLGQLPRGGVPLARVSVHRPDDDRLQVGRNPTAQGARPGWLGQCKEGRPFGAREVLGDLERRDERQRLEERGPKGIDVAQDLVGR
jgi:hypothetical protein